MMKPAKPVGRRLYISSELLVGLVLLEAFFISYINMGVFDFFSYLIIFGSFMVVFVLMAMVFRSFKIRITLKKNLNAKSFRINVRDKRSIAMIIILTSKIITTVIVLFLDLPIILFWAILAFLDIFSNRFIKEIGNNRWLIYDQIVWTIARVVLYAWSYLTIDWVIISVGLYLTITVLMQYNLDYIYLKAFVPDVVYIILLFGTPFVIIIEVLGFIKGLYLYVFD